MIRLRPSGVDEILIKRVQDWYEPGPGVFIASTAGQTASFSPAMLFTGTTTGAWYDPSDTTTLFRDAAGTLPVTAVEQPVGLMLDKSKGLVLGPELVTNGDFSNGTTGWTAGGTASLSAVNGKLRILQTGTTAAWAYQSLSTVKGCRYRVSLNFESVSGSTLAVFVGTTIGGIETYVATPGNVTSYTFSFVATATSHYIGVQPWTISLNREAYFDNISVRELPGNHAFNPSGNSANFPVLSARYNLLTKTEAINTSPWGGNATPSQTTAPDGTGTATMLSVTTTDTDYSWSQAFTSAAAQYKFSVFVKKTVGATTFPMFYIASEPGPTFGIVFLNTNTGQLFDRPGYAADSKSSTDKGDYWEISFSKTLPASAGSYIRIFPAATQDFTTYSRYTGSCVIWHPDLRVANDALNQPAYQRVNTATDYDTVGFKPYLRFNGTNQWLQTNSIDFTYGDKMFVCAGVRKLSDAAAGTLCELGVATTRSFSIFAPNSAAPTYMWRSWGSGQADATATGFTAPVTNVLSGIGNISGDQAILRVNGSQAAINTGDQGTDNYGNYPLYIGARAGTSVWANIRFYGAVVAGKQVSAAEITNTETYLNQKTGAY